MGEAAPIDKSEPLKLRPVHIVMDINRLGTFYPYPLSFMRSLTRRICTEGWEIERKTVEICGEGYGHCVYGIKTPNGYFSYVIFSKFLHPDIRSDRVIAEDWDMTVTMCEGEIDAERLERYRQNVPLQEKGRVDSTCLILSRANKSARNFNYVVDRLSQGLQPDLDVMAKVGYLYRTTAVYGSGKFGLADWDKVCNEYPDFARPFCAEMLSCFLIRDFSMFQAEYVAGQRSPRTAVKMSDDIKRYVGIGNATGLGMAPYLINHPLLINNWIEVRETALAQIKASTIISEQCRENFAFQVSRAVQHLSEITTDNSDQNVINQNAKTDILALKLWFDEQPFLQTWDQVTDYAEQHFAEEAQELLNALLLEQYPEYSIELEDRLNVCEAYRLTPEMPVSLIKSMIEKHYDWVLAVDFEGKDCLKTFWYISEEKMEPRLGMRFNEPGAEKEMFLGIAHAVRCAYDDLRNFNEEASTARFVLKYPEHRYIIRRIQTMGQTMYGEIRANLLDADVLPIHLLRCKLSFFGVGKFDPRSRLWVRNTMFQGAPLISDMSADSDNSWCFPVRPNLFDAHAH